MEGEKHGLKDKRQVREHKRECWFGKKKFQEVQCDWGVKIAKKV